MISLYIFLTVALLAVLTGQSLPDAARFALAAMFAFTGASHFTPMRHDFARMVPAIFPSPMAMVYLTGALEILGAAGLMLPATRRPAALCLALLLAALFPANIRASRHAIPLRGKPPTPLPIRAAIQILYIAAAIYSA